MVANFDLPTQRPMQLGPTAAMLERLNAFLSLAARCLPAASPPSPKPAANRLALRAPRTLAASIVSIVCSAGRKTARWSDGSGKADNAGSHLCSHSSDRLGLTR